MTEPGLTPALFIDDSRAFMVSFARKKPAKSWICFVYIVRRNL